MFAPYRRDLFAKTLIRFAEILFAALFVSLWDKAFPIIYKLVIAAGPVILLTLGIAFCPSNPPGKE